MLPPLVVGDDQAERVLIFRKPLAVAGLRENGTKRPEKQAGRSQGKTSQTLHWTVFRSGDMQSGTTLFGSSPAERIIVSHGSHRRCPL